MRLYYEGGQSSVDTLQRDTSCCYGDDTHKKALFSTKLHKISILIWVPKIISYKMCHQATCHSSYSHHFKIWDWWCKFDGWFFFFFFFCAQHQWSSILHRAGATNYPKLPSFHQLAKSEEGTWLQSLLMSKHSVWEGHPNCQKCHLSNSCSLLPSNIIALLLPSNSMFTVT